MTGGILWGQQVICQVHGKIMPWYEMSLQIVQPTHLNLCRNGTGEAWISIELPAHQGSFNEDQI